MPKKIQNRDISTIIWQSLSYDINTQQTGNRKELFFDRIKSTYVIPYLIYFNDKNLRSFCLRSETR